MALPKHLLDNLDELKTGESSKLEEIGQCLWLPESAGQVISQILGAAVGSLIGAFIVQFACKTVAKFKPSFGMAYKAAFFGYCAAVIVGFAVCIVVRNSSHNLGLAIEITVTSIILLMLIGFFVQAAIYTLIIKHPEGVAINFRTACFVSLLQMIFGSMLLGAALLVVKAIPSEMAEGIAYLMGYLGGQIFAAVLGALIGALITQQACKVVAKFKPPYVMGYKATFLGYFATLLIILPPWQKTPGFHFSWMLADLPKVAYFIVIVFFVQVAIYKLIIKHPESGAIDLKKVYLVSFIQLIFGSLLLVTTFLVANWIKSVM